MVIFKQYDKKISTKKFRFVVDVMDTFCFYSFLKLSDALKMVKKSFIKI